MFIFEPQCRCRRGRRPRSIWILRRAPELFDQAALGRECEVALDGLMHVGAGDIIGRVVELAGIEGLIPIRHLDGGFVLVVMPVFRLPERLVVEMIRRLDVEGTLEITRGGLVAAERRATWPNVWRFGSRSMVLICIVTCPSLGIIFAFNC